jgi:hypothetical protein
MTVETELGVFLQQHGLGTRGTDIFEGRMPDTPDRVIALTSYMGAPGVNVHNLPGTAIQKPHLQVAVRDASYAAAEALVQQVYAAVDAIRNQVLSGVSWLAAMTLQPPFLMNRDANEKPVFVFNIEVWRAQP